MLLFYFILYIFQRKKLTWFRNIFCWNEVFLKNNFKVIILYEAKIKIITIKCQKHRLCLLFCKCFGVKNYLVLEAAFSKNKVSKIKEVKVEIIMIKGKNLMITFIILKIFWCKGLHILF